MAGSDVMVIDRGDLPSLAALGMEPLPRGLVIWHPVEVWGPHEPRRVIVERHAEVFGAQELLVADLAESGLGSADDGGGARQGLLLLTALALAQELGCSKLIWPVLGGHDAERVGRLVSISQLASEMAELEQIDESVAITLPVVDLSDPQLVDLADDLGVPARDYWPCERTLEEPCGVCSECIRWQIAYDELGLAWPWSRGGVRGGAV